MKKRIVLALFAVVCLLTMVFGALPLAAATDQDITVDATPAFIGIANAPGTWTVNGIAGSGVVDPDTVYYAHGSADTTPPAATVADGDCRFTITNTSTVAIDLTLNFPDFTGGDAIANSDIGTNSATEFGAYGWYSGMTYSAKVIAKSTASDVLLDALAATTDIKWGMEVEFQTDAWASPSAMSSTVNIAAVAD